MVTYISVIIIITVINIVNLMFILIYEQSQAILLNVSLIFHNLRNA